MNAEVCSPQFDALRAATVGMIAQVANANPGQNFMAYFLGGIIAPTVGQMSDEYWREFSKIEICGQPGCDCHESKEQLIAALDRIRDDYRKTIRVEKSRITGGSK